MEKNSDISSDDRNPVELLAEEFVRRRRTGQYPSVSEYVEQYPDHAEEIRELFPTMMMMEQLKPPGAQEALDHAAPLVDRIGDFEILREIGRGGMGVVYEALQESLGRRVALKVLSNRSLHNPKRIQRFTREAHAAAKLHHTNIVPVFGAGEQDGLHYLVMQYINGQGLDKVLTALRFQLDGVTAPMAAAESNTLLDETSSYDAQEASLLARSLMSSVEPAAPIRLASSDSMSALNGLSVSAGPNLSTVDRPGSRQTMVEESDTGDVTVYEPSEFPTMKASPAYWQNIARLAVQVAEALDYAHAHGTYHRDIKPANLLLDQTGAVWVADFGLAKLSSADDLTNSGDIVGTLAYMPPEQFDGKADHRSDIYGLGLTLYELATLRPAFADLDRARLIRMVTDSEPARPRKVNPHIPRDLETIILKAIAKDPGQRYQSAADVAADLHRFLEDRPIKARRIGPVERLWRWCRRNRALAASSAVALLALLVAVFTTSIGYYRVRQEMAATSVALEGEQREKEKAISERERAETALDVALLVLDQVFEQVAPRREHMSLDSGFQEELEPAVLGPAVTASNAQLLNSLLTFFDRFTELDLASPNVRFKSGQARRRVADIAMRLGQYEHAIDSYRSAIDVLKPLVDEEGEQVEFRKELIETYNGLGGALRDRKFYSEAIAAHEAALELLDTEDESAARVPQDRYRIVETLRSLGTAQAMNRQVDEARASLQDAMRRIRDLLTSNPTISDYQMAEANVQRSLAQIMMMTREWDEARELFRSSREKVEALAQKHPEVARYTFHLVQTYIAMGYRTRDQDQWAERSEQLQNAARLANQLVRRNPDVPEYQLLQARSLLTLGHMYRYQESPAEAVTEFQKATNILRTLTFQFPTVPTYHFYLASGSGSLGQALCDTGDLAEARVAQENAISSYHDFLISDPDNRTGRWLMAREYRLLSETLALLGESSLAEEYSTQAAVLRDALQSAEKQGKKQ